MNTPKYTWQDRAISSELLRDGKLLGHVCLTHWGTEWRWFTATGAPREGTETTREEAKSAVEREVGK